MDKEIKLNWRIPNSWLDVKLDDIAIIIQGQSPPSSTYNNEQIGLPFFQGKAEFTDLHPVVKVWCKEPTKIAEPNDILLSVRAPVGSTNLANVKCGIGRGLSAIRYEYAYKFVFYYLRLIERELDKRGTGTTFKAISGDVVRNTHIPLPPLNEQSRIVDKLDELFSELEKGKEQLQTSLEQLKVYRQSILKHAFEGKLSEEWRKKQKKLKTPDELVAEIKEYRKQQYVEQLKEYKAGKTKVKPKQPKDIKIIAGTLSNYSGWVLSKLGDVFETTSGGTPSRNNPRYYSGNIPWVKSGELKYNTILDTEEKVSKEAIENSSAKLFPKGTLLVALYGATVGKLAFLGIEASTNQAVCGVFEEPYYDHKFLYYYLMFMRPELLNQSTGGAQPNISQTILSNLPVPLCSKEEQLVVVEQIDKLFSLNDEMEKTIEENLLKSNALKQGLLQKAFEGKLVEQDPTDEPASVLLERIKKEREEYLKAEKERKKAEKPLYIKSRKMAEELKRIIEILKESKEPVSAKTLWQSSTHKDDIDDFYAALKKHIEAGEIIELPRKGKESFLKLADAK